MPDTTLAFGFLESAIILCTASGRGKPRQSDLRRAVSSAYYAVFHELARTCAESLVGKTKKLRPNRAWVEVYRNLEHGKVMDACIGVRNVDFPQGIKDFSDTFIQLQTARQSADYDPMIRLSKVEALGHIKVAEESIRYLKNVGKNDKLAFSTWVMITSRGAKEARKKVQSGTVRQISSVRRFSG